MEYLKTAVSAAALYAVAAGLAPEREGVKKACTLACSLLLLLALLPKGGLPSLSFPSLLPEEEVSEEAYAERVKELTEKSIEEELCRRFSVGEGRLSVDSDLSYAEGKVTVTRLTVTLSGTGVLADVPALIKHVKENYGMKCEVITGGA